eukprot:5099977-Prymnesium_polylepis.1
MTCLVCHLGSLLAPRTRHNANTDAHAWSASVETFSWEQVPNAKPRYLATVPFYRTVHDLSHTRNQIICRGVGDGMRLP